MPCYDPRDDEELEELREKIKNDERLRLEELHSLKDSNNKLEAMLCAICNELQRNDILYSIISEAQRKGKIDILSFVEKHIDNDKIRLANDIQKRYSVDELKVIKELLK